MVRFPRLRVSPVWARLRPLSVLTRSVSPLTNFPPLLCLTNLLTVAGVTRLKVLNCCRLKWGRYPVPRVGTWPVFSVLVSLPL